MISPRAHSPDVPNFYFPFIKVTEETEQVIMVKYKQFKCILEEYEKLCNSAVYTIPWCNYRRAVSCSGCFKSLFGAPR